MHVSFKCVALSHYGIESYALQDSVNHQHMEMKNEKDMLEDFDEEPIKKEESNMWDVTDAWQLPHRYSDEQNLAEPDKAVSDTPGDLAWPSKMPSTSEQEKPFSVVEGKASYFLVSSPLVYGLVPRPLSFFCVGAGKEGLVDLRMRFWVTSSSQNPGAVMRRLAPPKSVPPRTN